MSHIPELDLLWLLLSFCFAFLLCFFAFLLSAKLTPVAFAQINGTENNENLICEYICTFCWYHSKVNDFFPVATLRSSSKRQWRREVILYGQIFAIHEQYFVFTR